MGDRRWGDLLSQHDRLIRAQLARYPGREVDTAGDGFFALFDGPARAVRCASAICSSMKRLGVEVRAGLHTGEIQTSGGEVSGIAIAIGARVEHWPTRARCWFRPRSRTWLLGPASSSRIEACMR